MSDPPFPFFRHGREGGHPSKSIFAAVTKSAVPRGGANVQHAWVAAVAAMTKCVDATSQLKCSTV
jgi:hypothetical protein